MPLRSMYARLQRHFRVAGSCGKPFKATNGVLQGCPVSVICLNALIAVWARAVEAKVPGAIHIEADEANPLAAAKVIGDSARDIAGSSLVTAMTLSCKEFAIRVSGLGDTWFGGPHPTMRAKLFEGHTEDEITWMGGESIIAETVGLGGFAQAAAFPLQAYQGGEPMGMVERNLGMYEITQGENPDFHIPFLKYRGTPTGIDIFKVIETGIEPVMDIGIAGRDGGQIGAGSVSAHPGCFEKALAAYREKYGG